MIKHYIPLVIVLVIWAILTLGVFIYSPKGNVWIKLVIIPLMLAAAILSYKIADTTAGRSRDVHALPERFIFLGRALVVNDQYEKIAIEVWIRPDKTTRLYSIPWSKQMEKMLDKAEQARNSGRGEVEMKKKKPGKPGDKGTLDDRESDEPYELRKMIPSEEIPKEML